MPQQQQQQQQAPPHYTLILRLPFPRPTGQAFSTTATSATTTNTISPNHPNQQTQTQPQSLSSTQQPAQPPVTTLRRSPATQPPTGSEGTPSMGSSFSDLSGASVAQSALEEALMSDLRADGGGLGSRVSTIGR